MSEKSHHAWSVQSTLGIQKMVGDWPVTEPLDYTRDSMVVLDTAADRTHAKAAGDCLDARAT